MRQGSTTTTLLALAILTGCNGMEDAAKTEATSSGATADSQANAKETGWAVGISPPGTTPYAVLYRVSTPYAPKIGKDGKEIPEPKRHDKRQMEIHGTAALAKGIIDVACNLNEVKNNIKDILGTVPKATVEQAVAMNRLGMCWPTETPIQTMSHGDALTKAQQILKKQSPTTQSPASP